MEKAGKFLKDLKENNNRDWFHANKKLYKEARLEFETLTEIVIAGIKNFDSMIDVSSAKECMFRINRDIRFSNNKDPYKTNFGALIAPGGKKSSFAGYYLHFEPGTSFIGGGIYMPDPKILKAIRTDILDDPDAVKSIIEDPAFKAYFKEMYGEKLKTAPKGFPKDFPDIELLRYKHYTVIHEVDDRFWKADDALEQILNIYKALYPLNRYLNDIIGSFVED